MKRKDGCPLKHKGSQCAEQDAAEKLTVCCKKSSELQHVGKRKSCEKGFWEATRLQQVQAPHRSNNCALAPKHYSIWGKTNVAGRIQGPPKALYILLQWLSYQSQEISTACTLGIHTSPKTEPAGAKECSKDHPFSGPWVNARSWLPQPLHNRGWSPSWAFRSETLQTLPQRSGAEDRASSPSSPFPKKYLLISGSYGWAKQTPSADLSYKQYNSR